MKRIFPPSLLCLLLFVAAACQSVQQFSIDYMQPAEVSFPAALRRVAVVNNMPASPQATAMPEAGEEPKGEYEVARKTDYYTGNPATAAQALADALADENYFDQVIICDSALRANDVALRESTLSREEVNRLARDLQADFLIAVEDVRLRAVSKMDFLPDVQAYYGTVDVTVCPTLRIYVPNRRGPVATVSRPDSIFWEEAGVSEGEVRSRLIQGKELVEAASGFAGSSPVAYLLPHWKTAERYLFVGGSVDMRDAAVYVREQNWDEAIALWKRHYEQRKGKTKIRAAYNIALGYELQDSIGDALQWATKAQQIANDVEHVEEKAAQGLQSADIPYYILTSLYVNELTERRQGIARLRMQMRRFADEAPADEAGL